jgi:hypothetical protein
MLLFDWEFVESEHLVIRQDVGSRTTVAMIVERSRFHWFIKENFLITELSTNLGDFPETDHYSCGRTESLSLAKKECDEALLLFGFQFIDPKLQAMR